MVGTVFGYPKGLVSKSVSDEWMSSACFSSSSVSIKTPLLLL